MTTNSSPGREPPETDTASLVRLIAEGDGPRFGQLYERVAPAVFAWTSLQVGPALAKSLDPEDVVQEVWCRALSRFASFDAERASFRSWIFGIANNVLLEAFRRLGKRGPVKASDQASAVLTLEEVPEQATSISRRVARDEDLRTFITAVTSLEPDDRKLLLYRGLEGLSHAAVADLMDVSADAASKRWQRLLERLRGLGAPLELLAD